MTNKLLVESSLFAYDTFADVADYSSTDRLPELPTGNAVDRGWTPLELPELENPGVDRTSAIWRTCRQASSPVPRISTSGTSRAGIP
jgi:hypothetical protein